MADTSDPASAAVDIEELAALLRARRAETGQSLRDVAAETGVPFSTLSRVESGKIPDLTTFRNIVAWIGVAPERFFPTPRVRQETTPEAFAHMLRSDPSLTDQARDQLVSVVSQMYAALTINSQPVQMHLRSGKLFTPQAASLLSDLISQMQDKLLNESGS